MPSTLHDTLCINSLTPPTKPPGIPTEHAHKNGPERGREGGREGGRGGETRITEWAYKPEHLSVTSDP